MCKGQVHIENGCGPWTGHTNISPPHPTPPVTDHERVVPVSAGEQERWTGWVCLCVNRNMNVITSHHPTPAVTPHPTGNWSAKNSACVCRTTRKMIRLLCLCVHRNMNVITPPHPTPSPDRCLCLLEGRKVIRFAVSGCAQEYERYWPTQPHPTPSRDSSVCTDEPDMCVQMNPKCVFRWTGSVCTDDPDLCAQMTLHPLRSYSEVTLTGKHTDNIVVVSTLYCGILRHMPVLFILVNFSASICLHSGHAFFIKRRCAAVAKCQKF